MHFVITGGHHNSALVIAQLLRRKNHQVTWIGHRISSHGDQNDSSEYLEVTASGIPFVDLSAGKLTLKNGLKNILKIPLGILRSVLLLRKLKPKVVISFGGYLGFAVSLAAIILRLPFYLHEQTSSAGLANKLLGKFGRINFLTWESSLTHFPRQKSLVVGLPLRSSILRAKKLPLFQNHLPTILVMGGKQGAHVINELIFQNLPHLLSSYNLIHQTGTSSVTGDYQKACTLKGTLSHTLQDRYLPHGYIGENEIGGILHSVTTYFGRSGAHIVYELALLGLPAILVPYLHSHNYEQLHNAKILESHGTGIIISESKLDFPQLLKALAEIKKTKPAPLSLPLSAGEVIISKIFSDLAHEN